MNLKPTFILVKEKKKSSTYFLQKVSASHEGWSSPWRIWVFYRYEGATTTELVKSVPENTYLKNCSASFSLSRVPHFCSLSWTPFKECWESATTAALDPVLLKADGKCPWQVPICRWHWVFERVPVVYVKHLKQAGTHCW